MQNLRILVFLAITIHFTVMGNITGRVTIPPLKNSTQSDSNPITILGATYGLADVTNHVADLVKGQDSITIRAQNQVFGDSWFGTVKTLTVVYRIRNGPIKVVTCKENESITIQSSFQILGATYGPADVTEKVQSLVSGDNLSVQASNSVFGDPWVGNRKHLTVVYADGSEKPKVAFAKENDWIKI